MEDGVDALIHAELVQIGSISRIELPAAVVGGVRIVIGDTLAAAILVGALDASWNPLNGWVMAVEIRSALIAAAATG